MASNIQIKIASDVGNAVNGINQVSQKLSQLSQIFQSASAKLTMVGGAFFTVQAFAQTAIGAIQKVADVVGDLSAAYMAQEKAEASLQAALKATSSACGMTATELLSMAESLSKVTSYSDQTVMAVEQVLVSARTIGAEVMPEATQACLDMAAALGEDAVSSARRLAKVLADPKSNLDALKDANIQLTQAQKDQITELQEQNKLFDAQSIVLESVAASYGGVAEALANTDAGKIDQLQNAWQDLKEGLGEVLMDSIDGLVEYTLSIVDQLSDYVARSNQAHDSAEWASGYIAAGDSSRVHTLTDDQLAAIVSSGIYSALYNDIQAGASYNLSPGEQASLGVYAEAVRQQELRAQMGVWSAMDASYGTHAPRTSTPADVVSENQMSVWEAVQARLEAERASAVSSASGLISSNRSLSMDAQIAALDTKIQEAQQALSDLVATGGDQDGMIGMLEQIISALYTQKETLSAINLPTGSNLASDYIAANSTLSPSAQLDAINSEIWQASQFLQDPSLGDDQRTYLQEIIKSLNEEKIALLEVGDAAEKAGSSSQSFQAALKDALPDILSETMSLVDGIGNLFSILADNAASSLDSIIDKWDEYFDELDEKQSRQSDSLNALLASGNISYGEYISALDSMDEERAAAEEKRAEEEEAQREKANALGKAAFAADQANALAEVAINTATAIMAAWKDPLTAPIMTALISAAAGTQIAAIASQQYTPMAAGGIVTAPTRALIGEGGSPELVLPLNDSNRDRFGLSSGEGGVINIVINVGTAYNGDQLAEDVYRGIERAQRTGALPKWRYA